LKQKLNENVVKVYLHAFLDSPSPGAYNSNYSGVVCVSDLIEKEMFGGSLRRKTALKSPEGNC
jgi:hypothetical protein